jgi:hypothetical protein
MIASSFMSAARYARRECRPTSVGRHDRRGSFATTRGTDFAIDPPSRSRPRWRHDHCARNRRANHHSASVRTNQMFANALRHGSTRAGCELIPASVDNTAPTPRLVSRMCGRRIAFAVLVRLWTLAASVVAVQQAVDYISTARVAPCALGWILSLVVAVVLGLVFGPTVSGI